MCPQNDSAMIKKIAILFVTLFLPVAVWAQSVQEKYIAQYSEVAVQEMLRSGIPASITLAQGILESGSGLSPLAVKGNNHFGIKCHKDWTGRTMLKDDDAKNECFRVYDSPDQSFRDHSDFIRYRDRYKFLFDLDRTDYKAWAYGLKQAGYATDPKYPAKLIKYIEDYNLSRFDNVTEAEEAELPVAPNKIEEPVAVRPSAGGSVSSAQTETVQPSEDFHFSLSGRLYSQNGVPFVYAMEGDTYASIARKHHLFKKEILRYNDVQKDAELEAGTIVYLQAKKNQAPKGLEMYIVAQDGESFHAICQRFGVKEKAILKLNGFTAPVELREGDSIKLR